MTIKPTYVNSPKNMREVKKMSDESKKCSSCGSPMKDGENFCPNCGKQAGMTCRHCGSEISSTEKFCHGCGKPTAEEPKPVKKEQTDQPKKKSPVLPIAILAGVILVVLILVGAIDGGGKSKDLSEYASYTEEEIAKAKGFDFMVAESGMYMEESGAAFVLINGTMNTITASAGDYSLFGVKLGSNVEEIGDVLTTDATFIQTSPVEGGERAILIEKATGYMINYDYGADGIIYSFGYVLESQQMAEPVVEESTDISEVAEEPIVEETLEEDNIGDTTETTELDVYDENGVLTAFKAPGTWELEENSSGEEVSEVADVYLDGFVGYNTKVDIHMQFGDDIYNLGEYDATWNTADNTINFTYEDYENGGTGTGIINTNMTEPWIIYLSLYDSTGNTFFESELINYELFAASGNDFS